MASTRSFQARRSNTATTTRASPVVNRTPGSSSSAGLLRLRGSAERANPEPSAGNNSSQSPRVKKNSSGATSNQGSLPQNGSNEASSSGRQSDRSLSSQNERKNRSGGRLRCQELLPMPVPSGGLNERCPNTDPPVRIERCTLVQNPDHGLVFNLCRRCHTRDAQQRATDIPEALQSNREALHCREHSEQNRRSHTRTRTRLPVSTCTCLDTINDGWRCRGCSELARRHQFRLGHAPHISLSHLHRTKDRRLRKWVVRETRVPRKRMACPTRRTDAQDTDPRMRPYCGKAPWMKWTGHGVGRMLEPNDLVTRQCLNCNGLIIR